ncbi:hypothetical protein LCGC14_1924860 [marine sediment metagenome]|uniref:Uncharacterized protein n=1 Tax=marine sediment metagenome TaxID=412755 RepID=A0A0F9IMI3_9ZZZZ
MFRDIDYMKNFLKQLDYYPPLIEVGKMRHLKENFNKRRPLEYFDYLDFDVNLVLTASVKTIIPSLKLGLGDTFFVAWMLVRTPSREIFPANFYYDRHRMAIG